jgi:hypothetical protein
VHFDPNAFSPGRGTEFPGLVLYDQVPAGIDHERIYEIHDH